MLPSDTSSFFGRRFGEDLSDVRVHTGTGAVAMAKKHNAQAVTVGSDIHFGVGRYQPRTSLGRRILAHELAHVIQQREGGRRTVDLMPDVGFLVRSLSRKAGVLDDPSDTGGVVDWPLSFAVDSPLTAEAEVEVTGAAGDPCPSVDVGWLQTVWAQHLHYYYWGAAPGDGSVIVETHTTSPLPVRDGEAGIRWYASTAHASPTACGDRVTASMDDYPTVFNLSKVRRNSRTRKDNHLTGVRRGISFVTTLVAIEGSSVHPLRHFYWNYQMSIDFRPNRSSVTAVWPFTWNRNRANLGRVRSGASGAVPMFTTASPRYGSMLSETVRERL